MKSSTRQALTGMFSLFLIVITAIGVYESSATEHPFPSEKRILLRDAFAIAAAVNALKADTPDETIEKYGSADIFYRARFEYVYYSENEAPIGSIKVVFRPPGALMGGWIEYIVETSDFIAIRTE